MLILKELLLYKAAKIEFRLCSFVTTDYCLPSGWQHLNSYQDYECNEKFPIPDERISLLLPECFQDKIVRVYSKKPELVWC